MRRTIVSLVVAGVIAGPVAAAFAGPPIGLSQCDMQRLLGYENVKECEDPDS